MTTINYDFLMTILGLIIIFMFCSSFCETYKLYKKKRKEYFEILKQ